MNMRWDKLGADMIIRSGLLRAFERREESQEGILRILVYHRIGTPDVASHLEDPSLYSASAEGFAEQMEFLAENYHVMSLEELLDALGRGHRLQPRSVMVTFDDAYRDFQENAWPVLCRLHIPTLMFAPTDYVSDPSRMFWWDRLHQAVWRSECEELDIPGLGHWVMTDKVQRQHAYGTIRRQLKRLDHHQAMDVLDKLVEALQVKLAPMGQVLSWDELRAMAREGLYVAPHTVTHPILSRISPDEARNEIAGSRDVVAREMGKSWPIFAYPVGHAPDLQPGLKQLLRSEGFDAAVTMLEGHNRLSVDDRYWLRRVGMAPHLSLGEFRVVLTQLYNTYAALHGVAHIPM